MQINSTQEVQINSTQETREIMTKILVSFPMHKGTREKYIEAAPDCDFEFIKWKEYTEDVVKGKDIILGNIPPKMLPLADKVKWIQLHSAGNDVYMRDKSLLAGITLTNASGCYGTAIAEYMTGALYGLQMKLFQYDRAMRQHKWTDEGRITSVEGAEILIVGLGNIGSEFAWRMHALGARVTAVKRTAGEKPDYVDELYTIDKLDGLLPKADVVAITIPETPETIHMFGKERFALMKDTAYLINTSRGTIIKQDELTDALSNGVIGGACIDVYEKEPLPDDDPLWDAPNVLITPHSSGGWHLYGTIEKLNALAIRNLKTYLAGGELENIVDLKRGY